MTNLMIVLSGHLADGGDASSPTDSVDLLKVWVPAVVAVFAALVAVWNAWRERRRTNNTNEIALRRAQLNELYGPLIMWRQASAELRKVLPTYEDDGVTRWRLVDHIEEV